MAMRRWARSGGLLAVVLPLACACSTMSRLTAGDPDPGHQAMSALAPVLSAVPAGAVVSHEDRTDSHWDSCDGRSSTYGWDPITGQAMFTSGAGESQVTAHVSAVMRRLGWRGAPGAGGTWTWSRQVGGRTATATLESDAAGDWSLDATAPPAADPVTGC